MNDLDVLIQAAVYIGIASVVSVGYLVYVLRDAFTNSKVIDHRPQEMKFTTEYNLKCSSNQYGIARLIMLCWTIPVFAIGLSLIDTGIGAIIGGPLIFGW